MGNAFIEAPGLYVYIVGQPRPKSASKLPYRSLDKAGLQITFTFLAHPEILRQSYRKIAQASGVALGTVTPVISDLKNRGLLREKSIRKLLDPQRLFEEWVTHYPITLRPKLNPRRFAVERQRLDSADLGEFDASWSGEKAAEKLTGYLRPAFFSIYAHEPARRLISALRLRAEPNGNVEVLNRFWNFTPDGDFPNLVPPILVYADLMASGDGRNMEAAQLIYEQLIEPAFKTFTAVD
ncbi:MAG: type IV toxin-antitoxin system AbiEi family antitoxin [Bryobacteraceae bacterium]